MPMQALFESISVARLQVPYGAGERETVGIRTRNQATLEFPWRRPLRAHQ